MQPQRLNDTDRKQWIQNEPFLYTWWVTETGERRLSHFVKEHRTELDRYINNQLNQEGE